MTELHNDESAAGHHEFHIIVNTRKKEVSTRELTFDALVALAFDPVPTRARDPIRDHLPKGREATP